MHNYVKIYIIIKQRDMHIIKGRKDRQMRIDKFAAEQTGVSRAEAKDLI